MVEQSMNEPGIYDGISPERYHALRALSASGCKTLIDECPAVFWHEHMAPQEQDEDESRFDIGTAAHLLYLEPEQFAARSAVIEADSYRTGAAREARAAARAAGKVPLLEHQLALVMDMRTALLAEVGDLFTGGRAERTYLWRDPETGVPMRGRPDYVKPGLLLDFKTSASANPRAFQARVWDNGHHIQAALYLDAHELLTGERGEWLWIVQATKPPYAVTAFRPTPSVIHWGREQYRAAVDLYARCLESGEWPAYASEPVLLDLPKYAEYRLMERQEAGDFERKRRGSKPIDPKLARALHQFQSPLGA
jgi:hypothetical protein